MTLEFFYHKAITLRTTKLVNTNLPGTCVTAPVLPKNLFQRKILFVIELGDFSGFFTFLLSKGFPFVINISFYISTSSLCFQQTWRSPILKSKTLIYLNYLQKLQGF